MLQSIRDKSKGWLSALVIVAVIMAFSLWGVQSYLGSSSRSQAVATVNKQGVSQAAFHAAYERLKQQKIFQLGSSFVLDSAMKTQLSKEALDQLILEKILSRAAVAEGYRINTSEVEKALLQIPAFQEGGRFTVRRFHEVLSRILYTPSSFLDDLKTTLLIDQVRDGIINSAFALPSDVERAIKLVNQKRDFGYITIPTSRFAVKITDAQARTYYQKHMDSFRVPEKVSLAYVQLSFSEMLAKASPHDEQLKAFYQSHLDRYTRSQRWQVAQVLVKLPEKATAAQLDAAQAKIRALMQRLHAGEPFSKLAKIYSDDRASAQAGGVLPWFGEGERDPAIENTTKLLKKPGDVSSVVRTKEGLSLIKLLASQKAELLPFDQVHEQVKKAFVQQDTEEKFSEASDQLANLAYANPDSLEPAAKALGLKIYTTDFFDRYSGKTTLTMHPKIIEVAFSHEALQGNNSDLIDLAPGTWIVLRVKQYKPASVKPFSSVRSEILQILSQQRAEQEAHALAEAVIKKLNHGAKPARLAQEMHLTWRWVSQASRYDSKISSVILNTAFQMPHPEAGQSKYSGVKLANGDYVVVALSRLYDHVSNGQIATQRALYKKELGNNFGQFDYGLYVRDLVNRSKVVVHNQK